MATVTKTASAGEAIQTYVGPVVVGPSGILLGPTGHGTGLCLAVLQQQWASSSTWGWH